MADPQVAADYDDRGARAAWSVLIELGQILGAYRGGIVVVGGSVPAVLMRHARPEHVGTLDIDLDLDPEALSEGQYAELVETLERQGYQRDVEGLKPFQLRRMVDARDGGEPIAVIVDLLMPRDAKTTKNRPPLIEGLRVQGIDGGEVALANQVEVAIEGEMPDGRRNRVVMHFATIPALLVMKGFAIVQRDKLKDSYDIWFCIRNFDGGIDALAEACRPLLEDGVCSQAWGNIAGKFRSEDDFGPQSVRRFVTDSRALGDMTPEQVQTDAQRQVQAWLKALGLVP